MGFSLFASAGGATGPWDFSRWLLVEMQRAHGIFSPFAIAGGPTDPWDFPVWLLLEVQRANGIFPLLLVLQVLCGHCD